METRKYTGTEVPATGSSSGATAPHETLLDLLACGLGYGAARSLGYEEAQCLLFIQAHRSELAALDSESARIASLAFADPDEQRRLLAGLGLRAKALEHRFRRNYPPPGHAALEGA